MPETFTRQSCSHSTVTLCVTDTPENNKLPSTISLHMPKHVESRQDTQTRTSKQARTYAYIHPLQHSLLKPIEITLRSQGNSDDPVTSTLQSVRSQLR